MRFMLYAKLPPRVLAKPEDWRGFAEPIKFGAEREATKLKGISVERWLSYMWNDVSLSRS